MNPTIRLEPTEALVVVGSEAWNPADRSLGREHIRPLQVLTSDGAFVVERFNDLGPRGLRDFVVLADGRVVITTGYDLYELVRGELRRWELAGVSDIHELVAVPGGGLLVANTAHDQGVELGPDGALVRRWQLESFRHAASQPISHDRPLGGALGGRDPDRDDHFHGNEYLRSHDGETLVLVHHVTGFRPLRHLRQRLVGHGDGGVINLETREVHRLGLRAPHSLRLIRGGYAVLDSGAAEAVRYDPFFHQKERWPTPGWGRGLAIAEDGRWFIGISATRARYLTPGEDPGSNFVVATDEHGTERGRWPVVGVEQIWSVRLVSRALGDELARLT
jgi:hypothetical protein